MSLTPTMVRAPHPRPRFYERCLIDGGETDAPEAGTKEFFSSWALFILIMLLIFALFTSYILQQKKIQAVHETVLSIFAGTSIRVPEGPRTTF